MIEASIDPMVTIAPDGKITDVNTATETVTGHQREELIGTDFSDYFTEPEQARQGYKKVFDEGTVRDYPLEIRHQDGHVTPVMYNASVYKDEAGRVIGVFAAARDITAQRKAEQIAEAERRRFNDVLDMLPVYVILLAPDYHVPFVNRFFEERFGKSCGKRCYEYLFGRTEPCENCETFKVLERKKPHNWKWTGPDGRDYDIFDFPFTDTNGTVMIMEVGMDITERNRAENALRVAGAYNRSLIEASMDPLVTIAPDGKITDVNAATEGATGNTRHELIGTDFSDYFTDRAKAREGYKQVFEKGFVTDYPLEIRHRDGTITQVIYNASVYKDDAGKVTGVFAAARDITELKKAEDALRVAHDGLEMRVIQRTRELSEANRALREEIEQRERAEAELLESKAQAELYVDLMAHDINNMNHIALGFIEMALETKSHDREYEELMKKPIDHLKASSRLIDNVRKLQRVKSGQMRRSPVELGPMLARIVKSYSDIPGSQVVIDYAGLDGCYVMANELLADVFTNLIGNSIKHSEGRVAIHIDITKETGPGGQSLYRVAVEDNGPGIPDEMKEKIFIRFRRGQTRAGGSGLGLYLVKTLLDQFSGKVRVEDRVPGNHSAGSRFIVVLPASDAPVDKRP